MKNKKDLLLRAGWLLLGLALLYFAGGDQPVGLAVWLAPVFILRFFRDVGAFKAFLIVFPLMTAVELIADKGMMPFPTFKLLLFSTGLGIFFSLLPYLIHALFKNSLSIALRTLLFPSLAVSISFVLGSYGTWGAKANGINNLAVLQLVSITGVAGISFLIYWTAAVVNEIWEQRGNQQRSMRNLTTVFLSVLMAVYCFGLIRLRWEYNPKKSIMAAGIVSSPSLRGEFMHALTVLVRNNPDEPGNLTAVRNSMIEHFHANLLKSTALADAGFDIVVWYEGAVVIFEEDEQSMIEYAALKAKEKSIYLGISAAVYQNLNRNNKPGIQPLFKNKLILISPDGEIEWEYSKSFLVPGLEAAVFIPGDRIMKGSRYGSIITGAICYELDFPQHIRQAVKLHASLILGPSNDWEAIKNTHARMARLRAIETGISLLRPANGGISIAADPFGRILSQVDNYNAESMPLAAALPIDPVPTLYSALGEFFSWICVILSLACVTLGAIFLFRKS